jgi:hypothetical protein
MEKEYQDINDDAINAELFGNDQKRYQDLSCEINSIKERNTTNKMTKGLVKKLQDYSDYLDASITRYEKNFENLEKMKISKDYNQAAINASTALEALHGARNTLYELFPEIKTYSECKKTENEKIINFNYHIDEDGKISYDKV